MIFVGTVIGRFTSDIKRGPVLVIQIQKVFFEGKFIVLKNKTVIGVFDDRMEAINETRKTNELGTFLVQHVVDSEEQVRFHSRHSL